jgi:hypothetical protein
VSRRREELRHKQSKKSDMVVMRDGGEGNVREKAQA